VLSCSSGNIHNKYKIQKRLSVFCLVRTEYLKIFDIILIFKGFRTFVALSRFKSACRLSRNGGHSERTTVVNRFKMCMFNRSVCGFDVKTCTGGQRPVTFPKVWKLSNYLKQTTRILKGLIQFSTQRENQSPWGKNAA
jgi:hypothetical protein